MRWSKRLGLFLLGFGIGFVLGYLCRRYLTFKNEVEVGDIVDVVLAVGIALFLQNIVAQRTSNARVEKDILIARITDVSVALKEAHKLFVERSNDMTSVSDVSMYQAYKQFANNIYIFEKALEQCSRFKNVNVEPLKALRAKYRPKLLGGNFPSQPYDPQAISSEERMYRQMSVDLQSLTLTINKK